MAGSNSIRTITLLPILLTLSHTFRVTTSCFSAIFSFGDSYADNGNLLFFSGGENRSGRLPYGETYFKRPTGRFSDGRLIHDFIAQEMGVPLLPPYLAGLRGGDFRRGANFAVAGATALESDFFREKGLSVNWTEYSLGVQIEQFKQLLPSLCTTDADCNDILSRSLFLLGEIGGNDYGWPFRQGRTLEEIQTYVPHVIKAISSAIDALINYGAMNLVVPGKIPIGCTSTFLALFQNIPVKDYDPDPGCIGWLNEFAEHNHNRQLKEELDRLKRRHPHATIVYADYYQATMRLFRSPTQFGFEAHLDSCCGGGGPYNYNLSLRCGYLGYTVCSDPTRYIIWEGHHLTEAAYKLVAKGLLNGPYANPHITSMCTRVEQGINRLHQVS